MFRPLRLPARLAMTLLAVGLFVGTLSALADDMADNARLLRESKDFRVRTQAALTLGASKDRNAIPPLCAALRDENRTVRIASATALGKLRLGGEDCLELRLEAETDEAVRATVSRALTQLGYVIPPKLSAESTLYLALDKLAGPERLDQPVRNAVAAALAARKDVGMAPRGETAETAAKVLTKYKRARGLALSVKVAKPVYDGGELQMKVRIAILSYPGRSLVAEFSQGSSMSGVTAPDPASEQELLVDLAGAATEKVLELAPGLDL